MDAVWNVCPISGKLELAARDRDVESSLRCCCNDDGVLDEKQSRGCGVTKLLFLVEEPMQ
jgi:hypothetical protein